MNAKSTLEVGADVIDINKGDSYAQGTHRLIGRLTGTSYISFTMQTPEMERTMGDHKNLPQLGRVGDITGK